MRAPQALCSLLCGMCPCPQVPVLYPFGHGLSYTSFRYSRLSAEAPRAEPLAEAAGSGRRQPLLHVKLDVENTGSMAAGDAVLLFLSFSAGPQQRAHSQPPWWQRWLPGTVRLQPASADLPAARITLPCTSSWAVGSGGRPEGVPLQVLAGFHRIGDLAPGGTAAARFTLTARSFQPFSPLDDIGSSSSSASTSQAAVRPYCGAYELRVGDQRLLISVEDAAAATA